MDRLIYTAMTGANHTINQQATVAHNLANAATNGYRAENNAFRAVPVFGDGLPTRAFVVDSTIGADFTPGTLQTTAVIWMSPLKVPVGLPCNWIMVRKPILATSRFQ